MLRRNKGFISMLLGLGIILSSALASQTSVSAASNRLWGQNRYETAVAVSQQGWTSSSDYVVLASGEGYADALCAAPLAKKYNAPILLTESGSLDSSTKAEIERLKAKHVIIIGGYGSISQNVESELKSIVGDVTRLGGNDRYETSVIVAKQLGSIDGVVVTSGSGFADALSIAPIAAEKDMPILLTGKDSLPQVVQDYITQNQANIKNSYIVGGTGVISDAAAQEVSKNSVRLSGVDRFETNLDVMKYFSSSLDFSNIYAVEADGPTGMEFADALSGTALAVKTSSPVILTYQSVPNVMQDFLKSNIKSTSNIIALGGTAAVPDSIINTLESYVNPSSTQTGTTSTGGSTSTSTSSSTGSTNTSSSSGTASTGSTGTVSSSGSTSSSSSTTGTGSTTTTGSTSGTSTGNVAAVDGDMQFVFSDGSYAQLNIYKQSSVDISSDFKNNNFVKIKIYSSTAKSLGLTLSGMSATKQLTVGWNEFSVPSDFGIPDTGAPGVNQSSLDMFSKNGQFNLGVSDGTNNETIAVKYE
jgi:putative cell wall-binding protein